MTTEIEKALKVLHECFGFNEIECSSKLQEAISTAFKELEQKPCEDCVSRAAVMKLLEKEDWADTVYGVMNLPSVIPQQKTDVLDKIRAEIEKAIWEDILPISDETGEITDEIRTPLLNPDDVFEIIDKYKAESEGRNEMPVSNKNNS